MARTYHYSAGELSSAAQCIETPNAKKAAIQNLDGSALASTSDVVDENIMLAISEL